MKDKKLRVNFDTEEKYHRAFTVAAGLRGYSLAKLFKHLADTYLQRELELAAEQLSEESKPAKKNKDSHK